MKQYIKLNWFFQTLYFFASIGLFLYIFYLTPFHTSEMLLIMGAFLLCHLVLYWGMSYNWKYSPFLFGVLWFSISMISPIFLGMFVLFLLPLIFLQRNFFLSPTAFSFKKLHTRPKNILLSLIVIIGIILGAYRVTYYKWNMQFPDIDDVFWYTKYHNQEVDDKTNLFVYFSKQKLFHDDFVPLKQEVYECLFLSQGCNTIAYYQEQLEEIDFPVVSGEEEQEVKDFLEKNIAIFNFFENNQEIDDFITHFSDVLAYSDYQIAFETENRKYLFENIGKSLLLKSLYLAHNGNNEKSLMILSHTLQILSIISDGEMDSIHLQAHLEMLEIAFDITHHVTDTLTLSQEESASLAQVLESTPSISSLIDASIKYDRNALAQELYIFSLQIPSHPLFDYNQTLILFDNYFYRFIEQQKLSTDSIKQTVEQYQNNHQEYMIALKENPIGITLYTSLQPISEQLYTYGESVQESYDKISLKSEDI